VRANITGTAIVRRSIAALAAPVLVRAVTHCVMVQIARAPLPAPNLHCAGAE
jgi:hypothetical protein